MSNLFSAAEKNAILLTRPALRDLYAYSIFSAKESVLKCCYYAFDCVLELNSIHITMKMNENIFFASILDHSINQSFLEKCRPAGHIRCDPTHVYTAIWV
ncbi:MAG: 4-phosphopantetheinyl transferase family protein [Proteobacteria bacterium]|nr:4-phosphopantetheinyl transferase family protein [Pseudomonadota bacterium]